MNAHLRFWLSGLAIGLGLCLAPIGWASHNPLAALAGLFLLAYGIKSEH